MVTAVDALCVLLDCEPRDLFFQLRKPALRVRAIRFLSEQLLQYERKGERKFVTSSGLSAEPANKLFAYQGFLNVSVEQHFYCKHRIRLVHPELLCLVEHTGNGHHNYYPLEMIHVL